MKHHTLGEMHPDTTPPGAARSCTMHGCTGRCGICTPAPSSAGALTWDDQVVTTELGGKELNVRIPAPLQGLAHGTPVRVTVEPVGRAEASAGAEGDALTAIAKARKLVGDLSAGDAGWTMSVPARPEHDPDLILAHALDRADHEIATLRAALSAAERKGGGNGR